MNKNLLVNPLFAGILLVVLFLLSFGVGNKLGNSYAPNLVDEQVTQIGSIPLYTDFLPDDYAGRTNIKRRIKWIVIHETGNTSNGSDAAMHNKYLHSEEQKDDFLSWHYTVDDEITVLPILVKYDTISTSTEEKHLVYIVENNIATPVLISYVTITEDNGATYSEAICRNLNSGKYIDYSMINRVKEICHANNN